MLLFSINLYFLSNFIMEMPVVPAGSSKQTEKVLGDCEFCKKKRIKILLIPLNSKLTQTGTLLLDHPGTISREASAKFRKVF